MFHNHQPIISTWARRNPESLARVLQFAIISARQKFFNVPALMEEAERGGREALGALYGWKSRAYHEFHAMREELYWNCEDIALKYSDSPLDHANYLVGYLATLYGLGFAKAGFSAQLAYGVSGCLDSVNLSRLRVNPYVARGRLGERPIKLGTIRKRVATYNETCLSLGGTESLWNGWCDFIATKYPKNFKDAYHVSLWHLECLGINH